MTDSPNNRKRPWQYSHRSIMNAVAAISHGMPLADASQLYNVPIPSLQAKWSGRTSLLSTSAAQALSNNEYDTFVKQLGAFWDCGFNITNTSLVHDKHKQRMHVKMCRVNRPVQDKVLTLEGWFLTISNFYLQNNLITKASDRCRVFNFSPLPLNRNGKKFIFFGFNVDGLMAPPLIICSNMNVPKTEVDRMPMGWAIATSNTDTMPLETFMGYMKDVFRTWLVESGIELPVFLYVSGNAPYISLDAHANCMKLGIILIYLPTENLSKPLDIIFQVLGQRWECIVLNCYDSTSHTLTGLTPSLVAEIFGDLIKETLAKNDIAKRFALRGLCPFQYVPSTREEPDSNVNKDQRVSEGCSIAASVSQSGRSVAKTNRADELDRFLETQYRKVTEVMHTMEVLDNLISEEQLQSFKQSTSIWCGDIKDTSLFRIWFNMKESLDNLHQKITERTEKCIRKDVEAVDKIWMRVKEETSDVEVD